jgi:hypothetical protein
MSEEQHRCAAVARQSTQQSDELTDVAAIDFVAAEYIGCRLISAGLIVAALK